VLSEHGVKIAPSTYYEASTRPSSKRALRDAEVTALIAAARERPFLERFGDRKMWLYLRRQGHEVARLTDPPNNLPFSGWGGIFGDHAVAAAMFARIVDQANVPTLQRRQLATPRPRSCNWTGTTQFSRRVAAGRAVEGGLVNLRTLLHRDRLRQDLLRVLDNERCHRQVPISAS